ncbi:DNA-binding MarR family transcriptional regulator [Arthrobacter silviterrae]|uniref:Winged helix-turn-helix transcriptional regulator n=1 Tax=Arthrobacter silviterrae TaxID=2026658 RepID=A0ABX0D6M7_9MICC|nr:MarR family winged helix-turn-helix transcriptional regulator [Arthrobacter silviterrae]MDQ0278405.1 DNA-binding MarR family transcriptional regulator [Arthrobacter silviterrae]NGN82336.1 winged helix-turn-helix transcriptional regulator [Arthrobacter silviterrae]
MDCTRTPFAVPPSNASTSSGTAGAGTGMAQAIRAAEIELGTMLVKTRKSLKTRAAAIHPELQPMGFKVLMLLALSGAVQQVALTHEVGTDKAVMSRTIKQLEALGLVTRTADPSDGRGQLVVMTPEAQARYAATQSHARQLLFDRLSTWDVDEVRRLADLLARLNESGD